MLAPQIDMRGKRVLIVDDNATNRKILTMQTAAWGMTSRATESPAEALAWIQRGEPFDIAVLDHQMPQMSGTMLAAEIRKWCDAQALPLILSSSLGRDKAADSELFAAFLPKPIRASQLYDTLIGVLAQDQYSATGANQTVQSEFDAEMGSRLPLRILVAEDHPTNQKLIALMLGRLGYRADMVSNGLEALAALESTPYDVVLMDVQMPEMDGLEATRQIRGRWPAGTGPRIVAMTANVMKEDRDACTAAGMNDYLSKPILVDELIATLSRCRPKVEPPEAMAEPARLSTLPVKPGNALAAAPVQVLDQAALAALLKVVGGEQALLIELVESFLQETPPLLSQMRRSAANGEAETLRRAAHTLKSSSRDFGAVRLSELCRELEAMGKAGNLAGAADLAAQVETEYVQVQAELETVRTGSVR